MGYGNNGVWHPLNDYDITGGSTHTFRIVRDDSLNHWFFYVDGDIKQAYGWSHASFAEVVTGVESYISTTSGGYIVPSYFYNLKYQGLGVIWNDWSGRDGRDVNDPQMCGHWESDTSWEAEESSTC